MKYLLDTHVLLWAVVKSQNVSEKVRAIIEDRNNELYYSAVSIWEVAIKRLVHPDKITDVPIERLMVLCEEANIYELPLNAMHTCLLETIKRPDDAPPHKDPFDRILIAQAKAENMIFLTHDDTLTYYNEDCIMYV